MSELFRHIGPDTDVPAGDIGHEALAEPHDLPVGLSLGIEVAPALTAAHGQRGKAVLILIVVGWTLMMTTVMELSRR